MDGTWPFSQLSPSSPFPPLLDRGNRIIEIQSSRMHSEFGILGGIKKWWSIIFNSIEGRFNGVEILYRGKGRQILFTIVDVMRDGSLCFDLKKKCKKEN